MVKLANQYSFGADRLLPSDISATAKFVVEKLFQPKSKKKVTVFLCGADIRDTNTARARMAALFAEYPRYEVHYPEDLFDDLLSGQGQHSLLSLENLLADSVDAVVILPESAGSLVELGAFANNVQLAGKIVCLANSKYRHSKSFINYGPHRLIRSTASGKVFHIDYAELSDPIKKREIYRAVDSAVVHIKKCNPASSGVANILEAETFVLSCIYISDYIDNITLYHLLQAATSKEMVLCEIAVKSALGRLMAKRLAMRTPRGYLVTHVGAAHVQSSFKRDLLDRARVELLNKQNRRNSKISYDRLVRGAHL